MKNELIKFVILAIIVFGAIFGTVYITNRDDPKNQSKVSVQNANRKLKQLYSRISVNQLPLKRGAYTENEEENSVLPDISEYPFVVNPTTENFITIYSSEKSEDFIVEIANNFNKSGANVNGYPISVGVRSINSTLASNFISSGKYSPEIYIPSSKIYGDILNEKKVNMTLLEENNVKNVSGIAIYNKRYNELNLKNDMNSIINKVNSGELSLCFENPLTNEDSFNLILTLLCYFDEKDPTSDESIKKLVEFQDNIPYVAYNVQQLEESLSSGLADGIVLNYKEYSKLDYLKKDYTFIPFGISQNQPIYMMNDISSIKKEIAKQFAEYIKNENSQKIAEQKGYNIYKDYTSDFKIPKNEKLAQIENAWKKGKSGSSNITAVFVADISGSMEGSPLLKLKASLNKSSSFIDENTSVGLVTFSSGVNIALPINKFDNTQKSYFSNAVKSMTASGTTAMYNAIIVAEKMLMDEQEKNPNTKPIMIVLTDGESNVGYEFDDIESITRGIKIPIYTIGYNVDIDVLEEISAINEASSMNADNDDIMYKLQNLFNAQM